MNSPICATNICVPHRKHAASLKIVGLMLAIAPLWLTLATTNTPPAVTNGRLASSKDGGSDEQNPFLLPSKNPLFHWMTGYSNIIRIREDCRPTRT